MDAPDMVFITGLIIATFGYKEMERDKSLVPMWFQLWGIVMMVGGFLLEVVL